MPMYAEVEVLPLVVVCGVHARGLSCPVSQQLVRHNVLNALACLYLLFAAGIPLATIVQGLENSHRSMDVCSLKQTSGGARVIDDTYNANPDSVRAAIDVLAAQQDGTSLVLGDRVRLVQMVLSFIVRLVNTLSGVASGLCTPWAVWRKHQ